LNPVRIPLEKPVTIGTKVYDHVKVRAPTYFDYMDIGEALSTRHVDGEGFTVEHLDRLKAYAERCVTTGDDEVAEPAVLIAGGFKLARRVHEVLCDFLYRLQEGVGTTTPTTSSSDSAGRPAT